MAVQSVVHAESSTHLATDREDTGTDNRHGPVHLVLVGEGKPEGAEEGEESSQEASGQTHLGLPDTTVLLGEVVGNPIRGLPREEHAKERADEGRQEEETLGVGVEEVRRRGEELGDAGTEDHVPAKGEAVDEARPDDGGVGKEDEGAEESVPEVDVRVTAAPELELFDEALDGDLGGLLLGGDAVALLARVLAGAVRASGGREDAGAGTGELGLGHEEEDGDQVGEDEDGDDPERPPHAQSLDDEAGEHGAELVTAEDGETVERDELTTVVQEVHVGHGGGDNGLDGRLESAQECAAHDEGGVVLV